jgi:hypothetical protein
MPIQMGKDLTDRLHRMVEACKAHTDECHLAAHIETMAEPDVSYKPVTMLPGKPITLPQPKR